MLPYPAPERYPGMPVDGVLRTDQSIFLDEVARDPAALGFEGAPEEIDRLRVAAVYVAEEDDAERLRMMQSGELPDTSYEDGVTADTTALLHGHADTRMLMGALRAKNQQGGTPYNPVLSAQLWSSSTEAGYPRNARTAAAMRQILATHDRNLYRPVIRRIQERAATISAADAAREIQADLPLAGPLLGQMSDEAHRDAVLTSLRAAQRAFRRAGTTTMGLDELQRRLGTPDGFATSEVVHILAGMGAVRRSPDGRTLHATDILNVPQGRIAATFSAIGENALHFTGIRRIPERARSAA